VLASAVAIAGGATAAVEISNPDYRLEAPGPTFDGRDVFAPAAAHLCLGVPMADLGPAVDPVVLTPALIPVPRFENEEIVAEVLWVDHFGNAQLNIDSEMIAHLDDPIAISLGDDHRSMSRANTYADLAPGQFGLVVDSYGLLSVVADRSSAADELGLRVGSPVVLSPAR
jgi:S-adenosylmethionine hydrolase